MIKSKLIIRLGHKMVDCETEFLVQCFQRCEYLEGFHTDAVSNQANGARPAQIRDLFHRNASGYRGEQDAIPVFLTLVLKKVPGVTY